jgi:hypothetical protein
MRICGVLKFNVQKVQNSPVRPSLTFIAKNVSEVGAPLCTADKDLFF